MIYLRFVLHRWLQCAMLDIKLDTLCGVGSCHYHHHCAYSTSSGCHAYIHLITSTQSVYSGMSALVVCVCSVLCVRLSVVLLAVYVCDCSSNTVCGTTVCEHSSASTSIYPNAGWIIVALMVWLAGLVGLIVYFLLRFFLVNTLHLAATIGYICVCICWRGGRGGG